MKNEKNEKKKENHTPESFQQNLLFLHSSSVACLQSLKVSKHTIPTGSLSSGVL